MPAGALSWSRAAGGLLVLSLLLCVAASDAAAQGTVEPGSGFQLRPAAGVARIDDALYLRLSVAASYGNDSLFVLDREGWTERATPMPFRLHAWLPLHLALDGDDSGRLRRAEWDEPGDFLRLARVVQLGPVHGPLYVRAGELANVRVGHGSIVDHFLNTLHLDHFHWGLHTSVDTARMGGEVLVDSVTEPSVLGARLFVRPLGFGNSDAEAARRWAVGASAFSDVRAPTRLVVDEAGLYTVDDRGRLDVAERGHATVIGIDTEYALVRSDRLGVTPYVDANHHLSIGSGLHAGLFADLSLTPALTVFAKAEYRRLGRNYVPMFFGPLHRIERYAWQPPRGAGPEDPTQRLPRLRWLQTGDLAARNGGLVEGGIQAGRHLRLLVSWEDADAPGSAALRARVQVENLGPVTAGVFYARNAVEPGDRLLSLDDALIVSEVRVFPMSWLYLGGELSRRWKITPEGTPSAVDDFAAVVGILFGF